MPTAEYVFQLDRQFFKLTVEKHTALFLEKSVKIRLIFAIF